MALTFDSLRMLGAAKDKVLIGPERVHLDLNNKCNLRCSYCRVHSHLNKKPTYDRPLSLRFRDVKRIIDQAVKWCCKYIEISGHGEPTLNPEFSEIVRYIVERRLRTILFTNATFDKRLIPVISRMNSVIVNFSAPSRELFDRQIALDDRRIYEKIIQNLRILQSLSNKYKKPYLKLSFVLTAANYKAIPEVLRLAEKLQIRKIVFEWMMPVKDTRCLLLRNKQKLELIKVIDHIKKDNFDVLHNLETIKSDISGATSDRRGYLNSPCYTGWFNLVVACNGDVSFCCRHDTLVIGNLAGNSVESIWYSGRAQALRLRYKYHFDINSYPFKETCENCRWRDSFVLRNLG